MRTCISFLLLILPFFSFAQSAEIEVLQNRRQNILNQMEILKDSLYEISREIEELKPKEPKEVQPLRGVTKKNESNLYDIPHHTGKIIMKLEGSTPLNVIGYEDYYYKVCVRDTCGYLVEFDVAKSMNLDSFKYKFQKEKKEREAKQKEEGLAQQRLEWKEEKKKQDQVTAKIKQEEEKRMIEKYGQEKVDSMKKGQIWIGMNKEQAIYSRGRPKDVNRTVGSWGTKEQWVYNGLYLYFDNDELTSWQD